MMRVTDFLERKGCSMDELQLDYNCIFISIFNVIFK
jgi:hypothetical protein